MIMVVGLGLDSMVLKFFNNLGDAVILWFCLLWLQPPFSHGTGCGIPSSFSFQPFLFLSLWDGFVPPGPGSDGHMEVLVMLLCYFSSGS